MTDHIPDTSKKVEQSPLRDLAGEWLTVSRDLEADHRHIWHAFHHLAIAIAADVDLIKKDIASIKNRFDAQSEWDASVSRRLDDIERRLDGIEGPSAEDVRRRADPNARVRIKRINEKLRGRYPKPEPDTSSG